MPNKRNKSKFASQVLIKFSVTQSTKKFWKKKANQNQPVIPMVHHHFYHNICRCAVRTSLSYAGNNQGWSRKA